ncbi:MAG TPA: efflux RND transporter permease subunit, partial [Gemmata sp.]
MWIVLASLARPYTVWVGMLLVAVLGVVSYSRTPTDILPPLKTPVVVVFASYRGMPAPDMEQSVVAVLERSLTRCDHLDHIESRSLLGIGMIRVYFRPEVDPDVAASQVATMVSAEMQYMPPGMQLPTIFKYDASAIPVGQLVVRSDRADDKELLDLTETRIRDELAGIEGLASAPVFGGTFRQVQIFVEPRALEAYRLTPADVARIVNGQSQVLPTGEIRIDARTFYISSNSVVRTTDEFEQIPLWTDGRKIVRLRDVARVVDGQRWRTNVVRAEGRRAVYMPLLRQGGASAVTVVDNVREFLPKLHERGAVPDDVEVELVFDQSQYVREAMGNLRYEGIAGAVLASLVVLLFLGSLRGTAIVALAIPLSVLAALSGLYFAGHTLNIMTLGGLALVLGRVIDDCIVDIENTSRHLGMGKPPREAVTDSAREISGPVLMATVATMIVFAPVAMMEGMGKYLFLPLAVAACMAMAASYFVARTVSPLCCSLFLKPHGHPE